jgi:hypothetical protein
VAVVDGSRTENINKTGVRLWTDPSFDQDREIGRRDALNPIANQSNGTAGSNQRRGAIRSASHTCSNSPSPHMTSSQDCESRKRMAGVRRSCSIEFKPPSLAEGRTKRLPQPNAADLPPPHIHYWKRSISGTG